MKSNYCTWRSPGYAAVSKWNPWNLRFLPFTLVLKFSRFSVHISRSSADSSCEPIHVKIDPFEELIGLNSEVKPRDSVRSASQPRSWFGPNGQYIRELPCPSCRGRGYTPCTGCGIERSRIDCPQCRGKGITTCSQCSGDCVIWEESIDEQPWEKARSISPLKVKEDDEVDQLDIRFDSKKSSKRVYKSLSPEVGVKISRSLKSLNAKTGLFSKRMKMIHRDPKLKAERAASIRKAKGTPAARKHASETTKAYFSNPENRQKLSIAMKGIKYHCKHCGREGHRKHYCPELQSLPKTIWYNCSLCGKPGHNRQTCPNADTSGGVETAIKTGHRCGVCRQLGHNSRTCPKASPSQSKGGKLVQNLSSGKNSN